jgi:hypothetical protein
MNYSNFTKDFNKPSKFTAEHYGMKVSVEYDHSDLDLDEVFDAFETLVTGMGYHKDSWKQWILERAAEYNEEDAEVEVEDKYSLEDFKRDEEEYVRNIIKSKMDAKTFVDALENPQEPNDNLKEAAKNYLKSKSKNKKQ